MKSVNKGRSFGSIDPSLERPRDENVTTNNDFLFNMTCNQSFHRQLKIYSRRLKCMIKTKKELIMKRLIRISVAISSISLFLSFSPLQAQMDMSSKASKSEQLRMGMHKLWEDHIVWTRNVIQYYG